MNKNALHPNEEGIRFLFGKAYKWEKKDGRLSLRPWTPADEPDPVNQEIQ